MSASSSARDDLLERLLAHVGEFAALRTFPGVDAIGERADAIVRDHSDTVAKRRIGTSRLGEPLHEYVVGSGPAVLVVGGVHPNEPIGFHTALQLLEDLAAGRGPAAGLAASWHIIPCIDPDGTRLNESWFDDPGDRVGYARGFYRPAPVEQVEWSFPLDHRTAYFDRSIPETLALMRVIDRSSPVMTVGLHNGELGGVYYYLSHAPDGLVDALHAIPERLGLPLDRGEPEVPDIKPWATAVFPVLRSAELYDLLSERGIDPGTEIEGGGLGDYLVHHDTLAFVAELPYWSHPDSDDTTPSDQSYSAVRRRQAEGLAELGEVLGKILERAEPHLHIDSQLRRGAVVFARRMADMAATQRVRVEQVESDRRATVAEVFSNDDLVRCFRLRFGSMLHRALRAEITAGTANPEVRRAAHDLGVHLERWYEEAAAVTGLITWPVERLVGVQYSSLVAVADAALGRARA